jgi:hypothetical protein
MPNLNVTALNEEGQPLSGVAGTLLGVGAPQLQVTGANGQCSYANLAAGNYRLLTALEGFNTKSTAVTMADADKNISVTMNVVNEDSDATAGKTFFRILTGVQYAFLGFIGAVFAAVIIWGVYHNSNLTDDASARGLITFLIAVVTVAIALILVMAAFFSGGKDMDKRFAFGKEVLTVLIGVLGTIVGFYYGQAAKNPQPGNQAMQIAAPQIEPAAPNVGGAFTLKTTIKGGQQPYTYTVTFTPPDAVTDPAKDVLSPDGNVNQKFTLAAKPDLANKPVTYTIDVKDNKGDKATSDKGSFTPVTSNKGSPTPTP